jgi:hypothetical protein
MAFFPNHEPEAIQALPADAHAPEPATQDEWAVLCPTGQDPFNSAVPGAWEDVIGIDAEPSGQCFPDDRPDAA